VANADINLIKFPYHQEFFLKIKLYSVLGDILAALHILFILYVALGFILVNYYPATIWLHLPCVLWGFLVQGFDWNCPLTVAEKNVRKFTGDAGYAEGFLTHHLNKVMYPDFMSRKITIIIAVGVVVINSIGYMLIYIPV